MGIEQNQTNKPKWSTILYYIIYFVVVIVFCILQSFFRDKEWNFVSFFSKGISGTYLENVIYTTLGLLPIIPTANKAMQILQKGVIAVLATIEIASLALVLSILFGLNKEIPPETETILAERSTEEAFFEEYAKTQLIQEAESYQTEGQYRLAIQLMDEAYAEYDDDEFLQLAGNYRMEFGKHFNEIFAAGKYNSAVIKDGYLHVVGDDEYGELDGNSFFDVTGVSLGDRFVMGLHSDGTVSITGSFTGTDTAKDPSWHDIIAISAGDCHAVGLTSSGTVVATGFKGYGQTEVQTLSQTAGSLRIVAISAGYTHTLALLEDGRVIACGDNSKGACNVESWQNVAAIYTGTHYSAALLTDGTIRATGLYTSELYASEWRELEALAAGDYFLIGLRSDGTLISAAFDKDNKNHSDEGQLDVQNLRNIIAIAAGHNHILALDGEGTIHTLGWAAKGACDVEGMTISLPS